MVEVASDSVDLLLDVLQMARGMHTRTLGLLLLLRLYGPESAHADVVTPFDLLADAAQLLFYVVLHVLLTLGHFLLELFLENCLCGEVIEVQLSILLQQLLVLVL